MRVIKRILVVIAVFFGLALGGGAIYQGLSMMRDDARFPMPGVRVDIGGRALHLLCSGAGEITVLLENGLLESTTAWHRVQSLLEKRTRVCSYDRAGLGWSDSSPAPARADQVAADLERLRVAAHLDGPVILVGWSAGGVFIRRYFRAHPEQVVGMVFVDSSHEQQGNRLPSNDAMDAMNRGIDTQLALCRAVAWTGLVRALGIVERNEEALGVAQSMRGARVALANRTRFCSGIARELAGFRLDVVEEAPPAPLGEVPLVVLTRGRPVKASDFPVPIEQAMLDAQLRAWLTLQDELAALSTRSVHRIVKESGHAIPLEAPEAVASAVFDVLDGAVGNTTQHQSYRP